MVNREKDKSHHPVLARCRALFFSITVLLGAMHDCRIFGKCLIVLAQEFKHEYTAGKSVALRFKREVTTWNDTESGNGSAASESSVRPSEPPPHQATSNEALQDEKIASQPAGAR